MLHLNRTVVKENKSKLKFTQLTDVESFFSTILVVISSFVKRRSRPQKDLIQFVFHFICAYSHLEIRFRCLSRVAN